MDATSRDRRGADASERDRRGADASERDRRGADASERDRRGADASERDRRGTGASTGVDADRFAAAAVGLHERLARAVMAMCGDRTLAEECAQEALARAWQRVDAGEQLQSLEAWTLTVALNWCRSQLRRKGTEQHAVARLPRPRDDGDAEDPSRLATDVHRAVLALPDRQREVVVLRYLLDMDLASIAEVTGTSVGAVKNALHHGRATLARQLATHYQEEPSP